MKGMKMIGHEIATIQNCLILQGIFNTGMEVNHSVSITCHCSRH